MMWDSPCRMSSLAHPCLHEQSRQKTEDMRLGGCATSSRIRCGLTFKRGRGHKKFCPTLSSRDSVEVEVEVELNFHSRFCDNNDNDHRHQFTVSIPASWWNNVHLLIPRRWVSYRFLFSPGNDPRTPRHLEMERNYFITLRPATAATKASMERDYW